MVINNLFPERVGSYPRFEPNQVLTNNDLNRVTDYLEQQDRLTRVCLLGAGIVCGLQPRWDQTKQALIISPGTGLTSEGYLIQLDESILTQSRPAEIPKTWLGYLEINAGDQTFAALELLEADGDTELTDGTAAASRTPSASPLNWSGISGKIMLLVLESRSVANELCLNDCDGKGKEQNFILHKYLMEQSIADDILEYCYNPRDANNVPAYPGKTAADLFYDKFTLQPLYLERFGYGNTFPHTSANTTEVFGRINNIQNYQDFIDCYEDAIVPALDRIDAALKSAHLVFSPVFTDMTIATSERLFLPAAIRNRQKSSTFSRFEIQYLYSFLSDLVDAYQEFIETAIDLVADCLPNPRLFPRHLWLGKLGETEAGNPYPVSVYRTPYTQPPVYNGNANRLQEARTLFARLRVMTQSYDPPIAVPNDGKLVRITPGRGVRAPLSERAIPFYYDPGAHLPQYWNPRLSRLRQTNRQYGYYSWQAGSAANLPFNLPLTYRWNGGDFFRIEGHVGMEYSAAVSLINNWRQHYNLPFDLVAVKLGTEFNGNLQWECHLKELEAQYAKLRTDLVCELKEDVFMDLKMQLPLDIKAFQYESFKTELDSVYDRHPTLLPCYKDLISLPFEKLVTVYNDYLDEVKKRHLFSKFALAHPGLEHGGGVPAGGTFVLVYVDPSEVPTELNEGLRQLGLNNLTLEEFRTSELVVADFFLPYSCCSHCPPIAFVAPRPRPIVQVTPTDFCQGDTTSYELDVQAYPAGGLLTGSGLTRVDGKYRFTPANAVVNSDDQVELTYYLDGGTATFLLNVQKPSNPSFTVVPASLCKQTGQFAVLTPVEPGGTFAAFDANNAEIAGAIILQSGQYRFDPTKVSLNNQASATVRIRYSHNGLCAVSHDENVTVFAPPSAAFTLPVSQICIDAQPLPLTPPVTAGRSYNVREKGKARLYPDAIDTKTSSFLPSFFKRLLVGNGPVELEIISTVNNGPCTDTAVQPLLLLPVPTASFTLELPTPTNNPDEFIVRFSNVQPPDGTYTWTVDPEPVNGVEEDNRGFFATFRYDQFKAGNSLINVSLAVERAGCTDTSSGEILVGIPPALIRLQVMGRQQGQTNPVTLIDELRSDVDSTLLLGNLLEIGITDIFVQAIADQRTRSVVFSGNNPAGPLPEHIDNILTGLPSNRRALWINMKPEVGLYTVTATPFDAIDGNGLSGLSLSARFQIIDLVVDGPVNKTAAKSGSAGSAKPAAKAQDKPAATPKPAAPEAVAPLLNRRLAHWKKALKEMGDADAKLEKTPAYRQAVMLLMSDTSIPAKLDAAFSSVAEQVVKSLGKTGGKAQPVLNLLIAFYLDHQVAANPEKVTDKAGKILNELVKSMKKAGLKPEESAGAWQADELETALPVKSIGIFQKILSA